MAKIPPTPPKEPTDARKQTLPQSVPSAGVRLQPEVQQPAGPVWEYCFRQCRELDESTPYNMAAGWEPFQVIKLSTLLHEVWFKRQVRL